MDFLQKHLAWFSSFCVGAQSKNCGRNSFFSFLFRIFSEFERKIFLTSGQKISRSCQNYLLRVQTNNFWLDFFLKFWIFLDFLQKILAWFSKFYLRVQSKTCGRNSFLIFLFRFFFGIWAKIFSDFRRKIFKKLSKLPSACPEEQFVAWNIFKSFESFLDFLQKPLAWFSNFYLRVQSKNCGRNSFLIFLFRFFFGFWEKNFSDFPPKNFKNCQNYLLRVQRNSLWLEIFF